MNQSFNKQIKNRRQSLSNTSILNQYYSNVVFTIFEIFIYLFSTVNIVIVMIELLNKNDKYLYYGVTIFVLYMLQGFYGFLNNDLYKIYSTKISILIKLFFLEHLSILFNRRRVYFQQISNKIYSSSLSSSFFQGRILSVICIYLISFYAFQSNNLNLLFQLSLAAISLNIGLYNPQFFMMDDDTCSEDSIHYTMEVYTRATIYSILFLFNKDSYHYSDSSTTVDFFINSAIIGCGLAFIQLLYNLFIKKIPVMDCIVGSFHVIFNCIYLRLPSNIAVHRYKSLFIKTSSYTINPQIVVLSAIHRLLECIGFFFLYYKYLDILPNTSNDIDAQIRITQVAAGIYAYILFFQILYVIVASLSNLRDSQDDIILKESIEHRGSYQKNSNNMYTTSRDKQDSVLQKESNDNTLAPIYEHDKNGKGTKESQRMTTSMRTQGQRLSQTNNKPSMFVQYNGTQDAASHSPSSSTENGSIIYQQDFEENQRFQALKVFNPSVNKNLNIFQKFAH